MLEVNKKIKEIEELKEELSKKAVVAQRLKDAQYSEENMSTVEKIYKYAADHMGTLGCACGREDLVKHLDDRMNNELKNLDKEARFEASKGVLPLDLNTCINNCDILKNELKDKK